MSNNIFTSIDTNAYGISAKDFYERLVYGEKDYDYGCDYDYDYDSENIKRRKVK